MKSRFSKIIVLSSFAFLLLIGVLAFTPHYSCACGQYEDGSQLTNIINTFSEKITGEPLIEKNQNPFERKD